MPKVTIELDSTSYSLIKRIAHDLDYSVAGLCRRQIKLFLRESEGVVEKRYNPDGTEMD